MSAAQHVYGRRSPVWGRRAVRRLLMALEFQAFMDESQSKEEFVLAGYVQTAETWASFARDWEQILPLGTKAKNGRFHFKMSEMSYYGKMAEVERFSGLIDKYDLIPVSFRMNMQCFRNAQLRVERMAAPIGMTIDWGHWANPYYFSFRYFLDEIHLHKGIFEEDVPLSEKIDFYFDNRTESGPILAAWSEVRERFPEQIERHFGANPRFEDDQDFLGLQAADFWAWWVRNWYEEDDTEVPDKLEVLDFGSWHGKRRYRLVFSASEGYIFERLRLITVQNFADGNIDPLSRSRYEE